MRMWRKCNFHVVLLEMQTVTVAMKKFGSPQKLNINLPYDPAIPLLGKHLRDIPIYHPKTYT